MRSADAPTSTPELRRAADESGFGFAVTGEVSLPGRRQRLAAVGPAVDEHVVARAQVHWEVALDRIPLVVLADQHVELVEALALGELGPAAARLSDVDL